MFKLLDKIIKIQSVTTNSSNYCYNIKNSGVFLDSKLVFQNEKNIKAQLISNYLIIYNGNVKEIYNLKTKERSPLNKDEFIIKDPSNKKLLIAKGIVDEVSYKISYKSIYNYSKNRENSIHFEGLESIIDFFETSILHKKSSSVIGLYSNGKSKWQIDLKITSTSMSVPKYFGCIKNKLLFSDDKQTVFVIDKKTGKLIKSFSKISGINPKSQEKYKGRIMDAQNFILDKTNELLIGVYGSNYIEIDVNNNTSKFKELSPIMESHNIITFLAMRDNPYTEKHLFVTTLKKGVGSNKDKSYNSIVAFNRNTLDIDWEHTFIGEGIGTNLPLMCDNLLLQRTLDDSLYVFQKQNNPS